jgi:hypothetical protein
MTARLILPGFGFQYTLNPFAVKRIAGALLLEASP